MRVFNKEHHYATEILLQPNWRRGYRCHRQEHDHQLLQPSRRPAAAAHGEEPHYLSNVCLLPQRGPTAASVWPRDEIIVVLVLEVVPMGHGTYDEEIVNELARRIVGLEPLLR